MIDGSDFNRYTYLYVEDDALNRGVMQMIMQNLMGVERLMLFEDSQDFMVRLNGLPEKPDLILLDLHMAPDDGFAMLRMLRADPHFRETPVIAVTASTLDDEVARLRESGFDGAICKPLNLRTFPALIERILAGETVWHGGD